MLLPIYVAVAVIMLVHVVLKKYTIVKRWDRNHLLLVYKQAHDKRGIAESLHVYVYRASIRGAYYIGRASIRGAYYIYRASIRGAYFGEKDRNSQKYAHPPF